MLLDEHWYVLLTIRSKEEEVCKYLNENEDISALTDEEIRILTMLMDNKKVLRMSYGVLLNNKIHITRGPLIKMDDYIIKYDKHNRLATLNLNFLNQVWKVGVTLIE